MAEISLTSTIIERNRKNFNTDWRAEKPTYAEQMSHFYMKEEMADVEFIFKRQNGITVTYTSNI